MATAAVPWPGHASTVRLGAVVVVVDDVVVVVVDVGTVVVVVTGTSTEHATPEAEVATAELSISGERPRTAQTVTARSDTGRSRVDELGFTK